MKLLFSLKNKIDDIYQKHPIITGYIVKLAISLLTLLILRNNIGFNEMLTNIFFVAGFAAICSFVPVKPMILILAAYSVVQTFSLASGVGIFSCILFVVMYLLYFRFSDNSGYVMILIPVLCILKLPILIPLVLAVAASFGSIISVILGFVSYYFLRYIHMNAAVFQGVADNSEVNKISMVIAGVFTYREMWYTILCVVIAFAVVYNLKKVNINRSNEMAISIGSGVYLIMILLSNLAFENITSTKLAWLVAGSIISCLLAIIVTSIVLPLDYKRTELLEFEDDEYKYYVRAVPKSSISKESVRIKRIYSRKQGNPVRGREEEN